ncbi:hypothetical protein AYI68_g11 [Smittium mucronatum]|uniref:Centrosomin N-terminal motif 1 domain-containing protein n=1 Tax=Smittium mucronatum TaxID=133383 RepID=A0A1R0H9B6_9FUNG|nr:hypothetical protein AYI68_g11 [Smittium mucronatum]
MDDIYKSRNKYREYGRDFDPEKRQGRNQNQYNEYQDQRQRNPIKTSEFDKYPRSSISKTDTPKVNQNDTDFSPYGNRLSIDNKGGAFRTLDFAKNKNSSLNDTEPVKKSPTYQRIGNQFYSSKFGTRNSLVEDRNRDPFIQISPRDRSKYQNYQFIDGTPRGFRSKNSRSMADEFEFIPEMYPIEESSHKIHHRSHRVTFPENYDNEDSIDGFYHFQNDTHTQNPIYPYDSEKKSHNGSITNMEREKYAQKTDTYNIYRKDFNPSNYSENLQPKSNYPIGLSRINTLAKQRTNSLSIKDESSFRMSGNGRTNKRHTSQLTGRAYLRDSIAFPSNSHSNSQEHIINSDSASQPENLSFYKTNTFQNVYDKDRNVVKSDLYKEVKSFKQLKLNDETKNPLKNSILSPKSFNKPSNDHSDSSENENTPDNVDIKSLNHKIQTLLKDNFDLKIRNQTLYDSLNCVQMDDIQGLVSDYSKARSSNIRATEKINKLRSQISKLKVVIKQSNNSTQFSDTASLNSYVTSRAASDFFSQGPDDDHDLMNMYEVMQCRVSSLEKDLAASQDELHNSLEHASIIQSRYEESLQTCKKLQETLDNIHLQRHSICESSGTEESAHNNNNYASGMYYKGSGYEENNYNRLRAGTVDTSETLDTGDLLEYVRSRSQESSKQPLSKNLLSVDQDKLKFENSPDTSDLFETISILNKSRDEYKNNYELLTKRYETELSQYDKKLSESQNKNQELESKCESLKILVNELKSKNEKLENMISECTNAVPLVESRNYERLKECLNTDAGIVTNSFRNMRINLTEKEKVSKNNLDNQSATNDDSGSRNYSENDQIISEKDLFNVDIMGKDFSENQLLINKLFSKISKKPQSKNEDVQFPRIYKNDSVPLNQSESPEKAYFTSQPEWSSTLDNIKSTSRIDFLIGKSNNKSADRKLSQAEDLENLLENACGSFKSGIDVNSSISSIFKERVDPGSDILESPVDLSFPNSGYDEFKRNNSGVLGKIPQNDLKLGEGYSGAMSKKKSNDSGSSIYDNLSVAPYI